MRLLFVAFVATLWLVACLPQTLAVDSASRPYHHKMRALSRGGPTLAPPPGGPMDVTAMKGKKLSSVKRTEGKVSEVVSKAMQSQLSDFKTVLASLKALSKAAHAKSVDRAALRKKFGDEVSTAVLEKAATELGAKKYFAAVIPLDRKSHQLFLATDKPASKAVPEVKDLIAKYKIPPTQIDLYYRGKEYPRHSLRMFSDKLGGDGSPMRGGQSAGAKEEAKGLGTMGAFLIDDNKHLYGLSNKHVFGSTLGRTICQPAHQALYKAHFDACVKQGTATATCNERARAANLPCDELGTVTYASAAKDIALAAVTAGNTFKCAIHKGSAGTPVPISGSANAAVDDTVWKYGSRTHFTDGGIVTSIDANRMIIKATSFPKFADGAPEQFLDSSYSNPANEALFWLRMLSDDEASVLDAMRDHARSQGKAFESNDEERLVLTWMIMQEQILMFSAPGDSGSAIMKGDRVVGLLSSGELLKKECTLFDGWWSSIEKAGIEWCGFVDMTHAIPIAKVLSDINSNTAFGAATAQHDGKIKPPVAVCKASDEASVVFA